MIINHLRTRLKQQYSISPESIDSVGTIYKQVAVYKVQVGEKTLCLKPFAWNKERFQFLVKSLHFLQKKGYSHSPILYPTKNGHYGFEYRSKQYYLTDWYAGRPCNFADEQEVRMAVQTVAKLHVVTKEYATVNQKHNVQLLQLIRRHERFCKQVEHLRQIRFRQPGMHDLLAQLKQPIAESDKATTYIKTYLTAHVYKKYQCLCHNDLTAYNFLLDNKGEVKLIDFDNCRIGNSIQDISSLLANTLHWSSDRIKYALDQYNSIHRLSSRSLHLVYAYLLLPREIWHFTSKWYMAVRSKKEAALQESFQSLQQTLQNQHNKSSCLTKLEPFLMR